MISIRDIKKSYNGQIVVNVESFTFADGETYALIGANGSGKSTLARLLSGIVRDDKGDIIKLVSDTGEQKKLLVGYLPQKAYMFDMNLEKNIRISFNKANDKGTENMMGRELMRYIDEKVDRLISVFKIDYLRGKNAKRFSGGEQQKVALARFMMQDFDFIILDEPTSAMDQESIILAEKVIKEYAKGKTMILITHELDQARRFTDNMIVMNSGMIV